MAKAKKLPSGSWRVRVKDPRTGKYVSFTSKDGSRQGKRQLEAEAALWHARQVENLAHPPLRELVEEYIGSRRAVLSPSTIHGYEVIYRNNMDMLLDIPISDITPKMVQEWINSLTISHAPKSVHNIYGLFTAVISYNDININLKKISLPPKVRKFKQLPTAQTVIDIFKGSDIELPVLLGVWCGMRMSEILGIRRRDIVGDILTINEVIITVAGEHIIKDTAKTYKSKRQLRLPPPIMAHIRDIECAPDEHIISMTRNQIYEKYIWALGKRDIDINFHDLRHINASVMAALGIPDIYAMERGGWSNTTTLRSVYQQTFTAERDKVDRTIDDYFSKLYGTDTKGVLTDTETEKTSNIAV